LYIRRIVFDAIGNIDSRHYVRGYLEEIDFCLRAGYRGFRNVCAPGVYVAHKGEGSFGIEKRYLVGVNSRQLDSFFPEHEGNYREYVKIDPLLVAGNFVETQLLSYGSEVLATNRKKVKKSPSRTKPI
ncbi:MAG: glycosyltransferase family 2 protein, partial [Beijerinckiaceae bacterium]